MAAVSLTPVEHELLTRMLARGFPCRVCDLFDGLVPTWAVTAIATLELLGCVVEVNREGQLSQWPWRITPLGQASLLAPVIPPPASKRKAGSGEHWQYKRKQAT
jgi:hypothetical protein